jgi:F0F1-type ATP synthase assembly protein I
MEEKNEQSVEQEPVEKLEEAKTEDVKKKSGFMKWIKGSNRKEYTENISFVIIVMSGVLVAMGIGLGSFIHGTILMGITGSFFVMIGIITYIVSQFIEV